MRRISNNTMPAIRENRAGKIYIDTERFYGIHGWEILMQIMGSIFPFKVEHNYMSDELEMWCYSEYFDQLKPGQLIPEYRVCVDFQEEHETDDQGRTEYFMKAIGWRFIKQ